MPDSLHPLDAALEDSADHRKAVVRLFAADGVICESERFALRLIDRLRGEVLVYRQRQRAADAYERNGDTRHTRQLFRDTGLRLVVVREEDQSSPMVPFVGAHEPLDAA